MWRHVNGYGHVYRHVYGCFYNNTRYMDKCMDMGIFMSIDMFIGLYVAACEDSCAGMSREICTGMCLDKCMEISCMLRASCLQMSIQMPEHMSTPALWRSSLPLCQLRRAGARTHERDAACAQTRTCRATSRRGARAGSSRPHERFCPAARCARGASS